MDYIKLFLISFFLALFISILSQMAFYIYNSTMLISDKIQILISMLTLLAVISAYLAPYIIEKWKFKFASPELKIKFKLSPPDCHITQMVVGRINFPAYYFRFLVQNIGRTQAEACEVLLEKIYKHEEGEIIIFNNFTPVNLKWSGARDPIIKTIQPDRGVYCDLGRVQHPNYQPQSVYRNITPAQEAFTNFFFELPDRFYSQWDCLVPGKYTIVISVYSKNARKITREFELSWSGIWQDNDMLMFEEIIIK